MSDVNIRIRDEDDLPYIGSTTDNKYQNYSTYNSPYGSSTNLYGSDMQIQEVITDPDLQKRRWKNRRRMAWISLITMIFVTLVLLFSPIPETRIKVLSEPITWFYLAMASIIGAYMGFTTWASKK